MRKPYIDNLRCGVVLLVVAYHIVYLFNNLGIISNVSIKGNPEAEVLQYAVYPWFMTILFLLAGMSAKYALEKIDTKTYWRGRVRKLLVPSVLGIFIIGWTMGYVTNQYTDMFMGNGDLIPGFIKYLIYCMSGIGPLWFAHELILCTLILFLVRKLDKKNKLLEFGKKAANIGILCAMFFLVWGSAQILNTPVIEVYRNGFYILLFLLGYYVFSHDEVQEVLQKWWLPLLVVAVGIGVGYVLCFWGENYATMDNLKKAITNAYAWFMSIALIGCGRRWWNRETAFTRYMRPRSFGFYVLHMPLMVSITYVADLYFELHFPAFYLILLVLEMILLPACYEVFHRIPVIRALVLGERKVKK